MPPKSKTPPKKTPKATITQHPMIIKAFDQITSAAMLTDEDKKKLSDPKLQKIIAQVFKIAEQMSKKDISTWFAARQAALQVMFPNRTQLYDLYSYPLELDAHMRFLMRKVALFIKSASFQITDEASSKTDDELTKLFNKRWFRKYEDDYAKSDFQGFTLLELEQADPVALTIQFREIPRKHVVPEKGAWIKFQSTNMYNVYRDTPAMDWLIEIGEPFSLGWLDVAAPYLLYKKNAMICWADFMERFGLPMPVGKTNVRDQDSVDKMAAGLKNMSRKQFAVIDVADSVEFTESSKTDAYEVFDANIERNNNELSKMILLNIMSADVGKNGSFAQSKTHGEMEDQAREEKKKDFECHVNEVLFPFLAKHGFKTEGKVFKYDKVFSVNNDDFLQDMWGYENFEMPDDYYAKKYGWPITGRKTPATPALPTEVDPEKQVTKVKADMKMFIKALQKGNFARSFKMHAAIKELYTEHNH